MKYLIYILERIWRKYKDEEKYKNNEITIREKEDDNKSMCIIGYGYYESDTKHCGKSRKWR